MSLAGWRPEILAYRSRAFSLAQDLERLRQVASVGAVEAQLLYASRILEVLARDALLALGLAPSTSTCANLHLLSQYGLLPNAPRYAGHALRAAGNEARHVLRTLGRDEGDVAAPLLDAWLHWYFCVLPVGPRWPSLGRDGPQPATAAAGAAGLAAAVMERCGALAAGSEEERASIRHPALAGIVAEALLDGGLHERARGVLEAAVAAHPRALRLRQLLGLLESREGRLEAAAEILEPMVRRYPDEEEATGILAGTYKRRWRADRSQREALERSHVLYATGWNFSGRANTYLGINAAGTALLLGDGATSRRIAGGVLALLEERDRRLTERGGAPCADYWTRASRAEALLLVEEFDRAQDAYGALLGEAAAPAGSVRVTREQAAELLACLGLEAEAARILGA